MIFSTIFVLFAFVCCSFAISETSLVQFHYPIAIFESALLVNGGKQCLLASGRNDNAISALSVLDMEKKPISTSYEIKDSMVYAVRAASHYSSAFAAHAATLREDGRTLDQIARIYAGLNSTVSPARGPPLTNYTIPSEHAAVAGMTVSDNGKYVIATVNTNNGCILERFIVGARETPVQLSASEGECGPPSVSADGQHIVFIVASRADGDVLCIAGPTGAIKTKQKLNTFGSFAKISPSGKHIAHGFMELAIYAFDGHSAKIAFHRAVPGAYLQLAEWDDAGELLGAAWTANTFKQNTFEMIDLTSNVISKRWSFVSPVVHNTALQDVLQQLVVTGKGKDAVMLSVGWGAGQADVVPTVRLFDAEQGTMLWTYGTPGSMFSGDVVVTAPGEYLVSFAGKHVHANDMGRGGDAYVFKVTK